MSSAAASTKKAGLIFLHGLGDSPAGWSALARQLPALQPRLAQVEYVFPAAPTIAITINGGMQMPGWFDLYRWPIGVGDPDDSQGLMAAVQQMEGEIAALMQRTGLPRDKIAIGGFSQGGAIALLTAYHHDSSSSASRPPMAACVSLSGWLTLASDFKKTEPISNAQTPLYWAHGQHDDKVLFAQQKFGVDTLKASGVTGITAESYPMGHESDSDELRQMAAFLDKVLFGNDDAKKESSTSDEL